MKVLPFKIPKPKNEALVFQIDQGPLFYDLLHQHAEIQISYVLKGSGSLIVGDSINEYKSGDVLVIGGNHPHVFKSDATTSEESIMYTLFFSPNSFGEKFFALPDLALTHSFFEKCRYGMKLVSNGKKVRDLFENLRGQNKVEQISTLLLIINLIGKSETKPLSSFVYKKDYSDKEGKRMGKVIQYVMENFHDQITLESVSEKANMSKNAFCRYFKKRTNKTFFQFLIEVRIEHACKLLLNEHDLSISQIAESCGFNNIANFNRKFKALKDCAPSRYRRQF
ncbi:AraC family transcriptional regulator [Pseudozobellia thermophila]|uniref:Transcriptional regulator, AraC family n=1 Tax=Pseudozobellia thermophila TaxID=192903 RepID=A0A1M6FT44_9FLAO|nr:AraC family transcriptional regulator [Pseudozobellia thermophila]SHJ00884.1 transcriptional regulator, AraC family [Pseudozobellia thermophila]